VKAIVLRKTAGPPDARLEEFPEADLMEGALQVRVSHSTLNYKDGLAIVRGAPVVRRWPMIPGVDLAGIVEHSDSPEWHEGDAVVVNGWGMGESHFGAYAERARIPAEWAIALPQGMSPAQSMAIGTAGYTAMLCLLALERHGLSPHDGALLVTGAAGGVGSVAVAIAAHAGWHVVASTGRPAEADYLRGLGAAEVIDRAELSGADTKPLERERWAAAIDSVGSHTLAHVLAQTRTNGAVAACGLAQGMDLPTTVVPFILRGVSLLGINSVTCPRSQREQAWARLTTDLDQPKLAAMTRTVGLADVIGLAPEILAGKVRGRVVVEVGG
jgi:acrylyl-CoA reductase (NADPH)